MPLTPRPRQPLGHVPASCQLASRQREELHWQRHLILIIYPISSGSHDRRLRQRWPVKGTVTQGLRRRGSGLPVVKAPETQSGPESREVWDVHHSLGPSRSNGCWSWSRGLPAVRRFKRISNCDPAPPRRSSDGNVNLAQGRRRVRALRRGGMWLRPTPTALTSARREPLECLRPSNLRVLSLHPTSAFREPLLS